VTLTSIKAAFAGDALRAAVNAACVQAGLPQVTIATLSHPDLFGEVAECPKLPALAVEVDNAAGRRLAANDYECDVEVQLHLAFVDTKRTRAVSVGVAYADILRAVAMEQFDTAQPGAPFKRIRWLGNDGDGAWYANDQGAVHRKVAVRFGVRVEGVVTT
jgi:hypothetical protein